MQKKPFFLSQLMFSSKTALECHTAYIANEQSEMNKIAKKKQDWKTYDSIMVRE